MTDHVERIDVKSAGEGIELVQKARKAGLKAMYFPLGGMASTHYSKPTHHVAVSGPKDKVQEFINATKT